MLNLGKPDFLVKIKLSNNSGDADTEEKADDEPVHVEIWVSTELRAESVQNIAF